MLFVWPLSIHTHTTHVLWAPKLQFQFMWKVSVYRTYIRTTTSYLTIFRMRKKFFSVHCIWHLIALLSSIKTFSKIQRHKAPHMWYSWYAAYTSHYSQLYIWIIIIMFTYRNLKCSQSPFGRRHSTQVLIYEMFPLLGSNVNCIIEYIIIKYGFSIYLYMHCLSCLSYIYNFIQIIYTNRNPTICIYRFDK